MRLFTLFVLFVCLGNVFYIKGFAQATQVNRTTLSEIVVRKDVPLDLIPPQVLTGSDLARLRQYNVADALRYFAGVKMKDYGGMGGLKTVDVRHMGSHHVGVFYNGIQVGNAQHGVVDLGKFSLDNLEQIALYNGQRSTLQQAAKEYASTASIYLQTKRPVFEENKKINAFFKYTLGSIQWVNPSAGVELKVSDHVSTRVAVAYLYSNGRYKYRQKRFNLDGSLAYDLSSYRKNSGIESARVENNWFGKKAGNTWQATLSYYHSNRGLPNAIIKKSDSTEETEKGVETQEDKNLLLQGEWTRKVSNAYQFAVKGKLAYDQLHYKSRKTVDFQGEEVTYNPQFDDLYDQQEWYLSATHLFAITPIWNVAVATDVQYNKLNANRLGQGSPFSYPERLTYYGSLSSTLAVGAFKVQATVLGTFTDEQVKYNYKAPNQSFVTPTVLVRYQPWKDKNFSLHSFYKHTYRLPSFTDLYYTQVGTANLKPEYARQVNLGLSHEQSVNTGILKGVHVAVDLYYASITDKIIASPTSSMMRWMISNLGRVENYGIESQLKTTWEPWKEVTAQVGVTYEYTRAKDWSSTPTGKPSYYGDQIPYAPWHSGSSIVGLDYRNWSVNYSFIYVGKRYNGNKNNVKRNELQPWYTHDLTLQKKVDWKDWKLVLSLEAANLANQYYEVVTNFPMPGRNVRLSLRLDL